MIAVLHDSYMYVEVGCVHWYVFMDCINGQGPDQMALVKEKKITSHCPWHVGQANQAFIMVVYQLSSYTAKYKPLMQ